MPLFTKDSLEILRNRVDLVDVIAAHIDLKRSGASFKAHCPFHEEKTPSFMIQRGDTHYHCFGCGAHGDAIQFLMDHLKMSFVDAVEYLGSRFQVPLQQVEQQEGSTVNKAALKEALETACRFYQCILLHTEEGHIALQYLYKRGIDLDFINHFQVGFAPQNSPLFKKVMNTLKFSDDLLIEAGLLSRTKWGDLRDFFSERITFPIRNPSGACIGFSARKIKEETFGGKYINTQETPLFKKSHTLFAMNYSRRRISKERRVIIVEGQIDALRLIQEGFNYTVASLGTAFGEHHVKELMALGVNCVYLALDSDTAGQEAAMKIGDLFQKEGIEVFVAALPPGMDPDELLKEEGANSFLQLLHHSDDYLTFLVKKLSSQINIDSPAGKTELVQEVSKQIRSWKHSVMVHESLRKLCKLLDLPENALGIDQEILPHIAIKKGAHVGNSQVDADLVIEMDLLRWLIIGSDISAVQTHIMPEHFHNSTCRHIFQVCIESQERDLLSLAIALDDEPAQRMLSEILQKKVKKDKVKEGILSSIQKILEREWMNQREEIRMKIHSGKYSEEEVLELAKNFDQLKRNPPKIEH